MVRTLPAQALSQITSDQIEDILNEDDMDSESSNIDGDDEEQEMKYDEEADIYEDDTSEGDSSKNYRDDIEHPGADELYDSEADENEELKGFSSSFSSLVSDAPESGINLKRSSSLSDESSSLDDPLVGVKRSHSLNLEETLSDVVNDDATDDYDDEKEEQVVAKLDEQSNLNLALSPLPLPPVQYGIPEPVVCSICTEEINSARQKISLEFYEGRCSFCGKRIFPLPIFDQVFSNEAQVYTLGKFLDFKNFKLF